LGNITERSIGRVNLAVCKLQVSSLTSCLNRTRPQSIRQLPAQTTRDPHIITLQLAADVACRLFKDDTPPVQQGHCCIQLFGGHPYAN
jgi:hypothetical protein